MILFFDMAHIAFDIFIPVNCTEKCLPVTATVPNKGTGRLKDNFSLVMRKPVFAYAKTKTQISFAVTAKLISAFVFAT